MKRRSSGGCGSTLFMLFIVFLVLKLAGVIAWSWWWVTSPLWLPAALVIGGLLVMSVLGVSVYKIVSTVLRKQGPKPPDEPSARVLRGEVVDGDVIDVEGEEVPMSGRDEPER